MSTQEPHTIQEITRLLHRLDGPEDERREVWGDLLELVYDELRALAHYQRARIQGAAPKDLQTTEVVHELYARLEDHWERSDHAPQSREHFFALAARAMRQLVLDAIRHERRARRGGAETPATFDEQQPPSASLWLEPDRIERLVQTHQALDRIAEIDPEYVQLVEMHVFLGLTLQEIAQVQETSLSTVKRRWRRARAWLAAALS